MAPQLLALLKVASSQCHVAVHSARRPAPYIQPLPPCHLPVLSLPPQVTSNQGQRMEGSYINKSLLTLGTVIHKLAAGQASHIPFRDSKLTRLLQVRGDIS